MNSFTAEDLLGDFDACNVDRPGTLKDCMPVTFWVPPKIKERYQRLQYKSRRQFGKKAREILIELIEIAEQRLA